MKKTVLLTGFEPFNGATINPAWEAVRSFKGWIDEDYMVEILQLPCVFGQANRVLCGAVDEIRPDIVICVGQAGGRPDLTVERVAINVDDAPIVDNGGQQPIDAPIAEDGPAAYFASLPVKAIVGAMRERDLKASVSQTAGTFVCNHVFYGLMHHLRDKQVMGGFIHVPYLPEQAAAFAGAPSMALDDIIAGLKVAMEVAVRGGEAVVEAGGATH
ncbi:pyroglutamyl-peptidase I [Massilia sp. Leaf139]|uniref:pyroglutamyl-peptidase I n=1 Tax=Massilia sp. Leaf139 TaxID=1736272 RepID=UPI0006F82FFC|nr:pyroglutamyl-peptidase I [Massilia sp. Leaf139]KQQ91718.1 pyrrolidone-carboxylate peptidase [Massilia sp. Leaf139]